MVEAYLYDKKKDNTVQCRLCHHRCIIKDGKRGICAVRENQNGILKSLVYGKLIAANIDPIEKKPLFHFLPASTSYSIATVGCNFRCRFCQNSDISQMPSDHNGMIVGDKVSPEQIVQAAKANKCLSISYTYTEPTIYFEYAFETAKLAHQHGIKNVFVTNGYMTPEALDTIHPFLDAANVDLKAFNEDFYKKLCGAKLEHVEESLLKMKSLGIWIEITTLIIPGHNDNKNDLENLARFIAEQLGPEIPWHISRFHPRYLMMDIPQTPLKTLSTAREIGMEAGLKYVYTGNVPGDEGENTFCHACKKMIIERWGFRVGKKHIHDGKCAFCGAVIDGVWK